MSSNIFSTFIDDVTSLSFNIPLKIKIGFIATLIVILSCGLYFVSKYFDISYFRSSIFWFFFIAIINLVNILGLYIYYNYKLTTPESLKGPSGKKGKRGTRGKSGKFVSCNFCKSNIYIQRVHDAALICTVDIPTKDFKDIDSNYNYFLDLMEKEDIRYTDFVNNIILLKTLKSKSSTNAATKFRTLMTPRAIAYMFMTQINYNASDVSYGSIKRPTPKTGYFPLGDSVYGGIEEFTLNSFIVNGNIMYPSDYKQLVSFNSYNSKTGDLDTFSIWRPIGQATNERNPSSNQMEKVEFQSLGDVCRFGVDKPPINDYATISTECLDIIDPNELKMIFGYVGNMVASDEELGKEVSGGETASYLITNKAPSNVELFSVWRTPINTFITNNNADNALTNDTLIMNLVNNNPYMFNEYGSVKTEYRKKLVKLLKTIELNKISIAAIICAHYQITLYEEIMYYMNQSKAFVPEFANVNSKKTLGDIMDLIDKTHKKYIKFNKNLYETSGGIRMKYDETKEKKIPKMLLDAYDRITEKLDSIPVIIENTDNLMDIINLLFDGGLNQRIAVDSDGLMEGGIMINIIQEIIIRICKIMFPPVKPAYMIKDECLGTFDYNKEREELIKTLKNVINEYNTKLLTINKIDSEVRNTNISNYQTLMYRKIGESCGHIKDYMNKIENMDLDEFTDNRIKSIIYNYKDMNNFLDKILESIG